MGGDGSEEEERRGKRDGGMVEERRKWDFQKFEILTAIMLCSANLRHRAQFHAGWSSRSGDMAVFRFFKMAAVRHLGFLKVDNFNGPYPSEGQNAPNFVEISGTVAEIWPLVVSVTVQNLV